MTAGVPIAAVATADVSAPGIEDDPQLRILGSHGRALESVLKRVHDEAGFDALPRERVGLYVATGMIDSAPDELVPAVEASRDAEGALDMKRFFAGGYRAVHPLWPLSMLGNVAVGQIATDLDIRGDNLVLAPDAVAGVRAFLEAFHAIRDGVVDAALVAGVDEIAGPAFDARRRGFDGPFATGASAVALGGPHAPLGWLLGGATASGIKSLARARTLAAHRSSTRAPLDADTLHELAKGALRGLPGGNADPYLGAAHPSACIADVLDRPGEHCVGGAAPSRRAAGVLIVRAA